MERIVLKCFVAFAVALQSAFGEWYLTGGGEAFRHFLIIFVVGISLMLCESICDRKEVNPFVKSMLTTVLAAGWMYSYLRFGYIIGNESAGIDVSIGCRWLLVVMMGFLVGGISYWEDRKRIS